MTKRAKTWLVLGIALLLGGIYLHFSSRPWAPAVAKTSNPASRRTASATKPRAGASSRAISTHVRATRANTSKAQPKTTPWNRTSDFGLLLGAGGVLCLLLAADALLKSNGPRLFHAQTEESQIAPDETSDQARARLGHALLKARGELEATRRRFKQSEETYRQMALNASDVLYAMYPDEGRIDWLGQIDLMLGYQHGSFPRTVEAWADSIHPDEAENVIGIYTRACADGEAFAVEYRMRHRNGSYRFWSHKGKPVSGPDKKRKLVGACSDITERKRAETRLRQSEERLARIVETNADAIVIVDRDGTISFANPAAQLVFGADHDMIVGSSYAAKENRWQIARIDDTPISSEELPHARCMSTHAPVREVEHRIRHQTTDRCLVVSINGAPLQDEHGQTNGAVLSLTDITGRKSLQDKLTKQAFHDALTDLPNRALFTDRLNHALIRCKRSKTRVAVFFIDLDNFKKTNDTLGHDAGDALLIATANRICEALRAGDTAARLGGDEFTIMLDNITEMSQVLVVAERVLKTLLQTVDIKGEDIYAPPSIGIALGDHQDDSDTLMKRADEAMYAAKHLGKARYEIAPDLRVAAT